MQHVNRDEQWFMQDGANPHVSGKSLSWLHEHFGERLISRRTDTQWSPHSPDLNPCDFYLWGFLKDTIFKTHFKDVKTLKLAIRRAAKAIPRSTCNAAAQNFKARIQMCLNNKGAHIEHLF